MALNPFQTPASPWTLPTLNGKLFNTTARVARLQSRWNAAGTGANAKYNTLFTNWNSNSIAQANTGFGHALKFLAAGLSAEATSAYNGATTEAFAQETDSARIYSGSAPYVYAWCKTALTTAQKNTLITQIDTENGQRETLLAQLGKFLLDGPGNGGGTGISGYIFGIIAMNGLNGTTDRRTNLRNLVQNMVLYLMETYGDGWWHSYGFIVSILEACIIAYHIASGEEALLLSRCPWFAARGEVICRLLSSDGNTYWRGPSHNAYTGSNGHAFYITTPEDAWAAAMQADISQDPLMRYIQQQQNLFSTPSIWTHLQPISNPTWLGLLTSDDVLVPQSPAAFNVPLNNNYPITGVTEFRGGWNQATDLVAQFMYGPDAQNDHNHQKIGSLTIRVGNTMLIKDGYAYAGRGSPGTWEFATPLGVGEVGGYTMCKSGISFTPSATQATREDRDGSAKGTAAPTGSSTAYPLSGSLTNNVRQTWSGGSLITYTDQGSLVTVVADLGGGTAFPQITSANTTMGYIPGASTDVGTFVIWDQFVAPGTIDHIRRNFWSVAKPTISGEAVLAGSSSAGVLSATGDHVVIKNGSYQATIQLCTTMSLINCVGGSGFESWFDGYPTNGANLDFLTNSQNQDANRQAEWPYLQNQWRSSFLTTRATAGGEMVYVITVGALGSTAPSYTRAQALALITPTPGTTLIMPGLSQRQAKLTLDLALTFPAYLAANTTVGGDNGAGFVEPSGNGYARKQTVTGDWNPSTQAFPCVKTNAASLAFATATGAGWGDIAGISIWDAPTGGNLQWSDYLGNFVWAPFTCTSATPGVLTSPGHALSNGDLVAVTNKYGGALPATAGSWAGLLTVANVTTNTFTVGVNTTGVGDGSFRKVVPVTVNAGFALTMPIGQISLNLA